MNALFNILGFVLSAMLAWIFSGVLRGGSLGGYEMAVFLSLEFLSAFITLLFGWILLSQAAQFWKDHQRLAPALNTGASGRRGVSARAANATAQPIRRPRLPQSEFARRWGQRKSLSYEQILDESRARGEQRPYRLKCGEFTHFKARLAGSSPRPTNLTQWRKIARRRSSPR